MDGVLIKEWFFSVMRHNNGWLKGGGLNKGIVYHTNMHDGFQLASFSVLVVMKPTFGRRLEDFNLLEFGS